MQSKGKALLLSLMTLLSVIGVSGASSAQSLCTDTSNGMPNGIWDPDHHEECDSGPNARGCTNTCEIEDGFQCVLPINFDNLDVVTYGGATGANWTPGYFERTQTVNTTGPTFAYWGGNAKRSEGYTIQMRVNDTEYAGEGATGRGDDDYIGFALGFQPEFAAQNSQDQFYLLIDWKARSQMTVNNRETDSAGVNLNVVRGEANLGGNNGSWHNDFWGYKWPFAAAGGGQPNRRSAVYWVTKAQGTHRNNLLHPNANPPTYGNTGWVNNGSIYTFEIKYTDDRLEVWATGDNKRACNRQNGCTGNQGSAQDNSQRQKIFDLSYNDVRAAIQSTMSSSQPHYRSNYNQPSRIQLDTILPPGGKFPDGQIAFYGLSQANVTYGLTDADRKTTCFVPVSVEQPNTIFVGQPPVLQGEGEPGTDITVTVNGPGQYNKVYTTTVDGSGHWSIPSPEGVPNSGNYTVHVSQTSSTTVITETTASTTFTAVTGQGPQVSNAHVQVERGDADGAVFDPQIVGHTYGIQSGSFTTSTLPQGVSIIENTSAPGTYRVTVDGSYHGPSTFNVTYTVKDNQNNQSNIGTLTVDVVDAPTISKLTDALTVKAGFPDSYDVPSKVTPGSGTINYGDGAVKIVDGSQIPPALVGKVTVDADGKIVVDAPADFEGATFTITYTVEDVDGVTSTPAELTITVVPQEDARITSFDGGSPSNGVTTSTKQPPFSGTAEPNTPVQIQLDGPTGVSEIIPPVDNNGNWTWIPPALAVGGPYTITVTGANGKTDTMTFFVEDAYQAPTAHDATVTVVPGQTKIHNLNSHITPGRDPILYAQTTLDTTYVPNGVTLGLDSQGKLTISVVEGYNGPTAFPVGFAITDGTSTSSGTIHINVNMPPVVDDIEHWVVTGTPSVTATITGTEPLDLEVVDTTPGTTATVEGDDKIKIVPQNPQSPRIHDVTVEVCDQHPTDPACSNTVVTIVYNDPPKLRDGSASVRPGTTASIDTQANPGQIGTIDTVTAITPSLVHGSCAMDGTKVQFTAKATAPDNATADCTVIVCEEKPADLCTTKTYTFTIEHDPCAGVVCGNGVCDANSGVCDCDAGYHNDNNQCVASDFDPKEDDFTTNKEDEIVIITEDDLTDNDGDHADPDTVTIVDEPENGQLVENEDGDGYVYVPDEGFSGDDTFTYQVCATYDPNVCDTVTVTVHVIDFKPTDDNLAVMSGDPLPISTVQHLLSNDGEAADPNRVTIIRQPTSGTLAFNANGDGYVYTSNPGFEGTDTFEYRVCTRDDADNCGTAVVTIRVARDLCADVQCGHGVCIPETGACDCDAGYHDDGGVCVPDDLCEDVICGDNASCDGDTGACVCDAGYHDENGVCVSDDLCEDVVCGDNASCEADTGACVCDAGYILENGACVWDDLCNDVVCSDNEVCEAGACICDEGYSDNGMACTADVQITTPEDNTKTTDKTPTVTGTGEPGTTVTITLDGEPVDEVEVDEDGNWTWTPEDDLEIGEHEIEVEGDNGSKDKITIDIIDEIDVTITTPKPTDDPTTDRTPTVTGTGEPGTTVTIEIDGVEKGTTVVDDNGDWTWTPEEDLELGEHTITAIGENGSRDETTVTIIAADDERFVTGGKVFGCQTSTTVPPLSLLLLAGMVLFGIRRRSRHERA